jgi:hypothetical protein
VLALVEFGPTPLLTRLCARHHPDMFARAVCDETSLRAAATALTDDLAGPDGGLARTGPPAPAMALAPSPS